MATLIPVTKVIPNPNQPRTAFDKTRLAELAETIKIAGVIQPVPVEDNGDGTYTLIDGERRWRACKLAGLETIPVEIRSRSNHGGRELLLTALIANIQREDMDPLDEGEAYQKLRDEHGMKWSEIAAKTGKYVTWVQGRAMLTRLEPEIKEMIRSQRMSASPEVARALLAIPDSQARIELAKQASEKDMTWRQIIAAAKKLAEILAEQKEQPALSPGKVPMSPAMRLARKQSKQDFDDETPPAKEWDALARRGILPPWQMIVNGSRHTCESCALYSMAGDATCRDCPAVELIKWMVVNHV